MKVTKASKMLAVVAFLFSIYLSCARGQCPLIQGSELGRNDAASTEGLISEAFVAQSGDNPTRPNVLLFGYNIVCLATGGTRGTYSFVSVVANFSCTGPQSECNGEPLLSQIEFGCPESQWSPSIEGSTDNIRTTPADGTLSTPVRTDCAICISPVRSSFANNDNHCSPCDNCNDGVMMCTGRVEGLCCNFFNNSECVEQCPSPRIPDANFDCVLDCGSLSDPVGGQVVMNGSTPGSVATYSCSAEFRLNGTSIRTCQTSGMWSESAPTCDLIDCGTLPDPTNGTVTLTGTRLGAEASYNCTEGFRINGTTNRTCQMDDEWSGSEPTCNLIDCGMLPDPNNGTVTLTGTGLGAEASYSCTEGFRINGTSSRVCEMDDEWSGNEPTCDLIDCGTLPDPTNGTVTLTGTRLGAEASYNCTEGFRINGTTNRTCQMDDEWSGSEPTCDLIDCGMLPDPNNGTVTLTGTGLGAEASYSCTEGFRINGTSSRVCEMDDEWSGNEPTCDLIDCGTLPDPINGTVTLTGRGFGAEASYSCTEGLGINGTNRRTCQMNNEWSGSDPTCVTDCGPLSDPINGTVEFTISTILGSQAFYRCMEGFLLNGNGVRMCQENGTWTGSDPTCEPVSCGGLSDPRNGNVSVPSTNFASVATYDCEIGFNLVGQTTRRCLSSRIWSGFAPICEAVDCGDLQVSNGTVDLRNGTRFPAVAIYTCNRGYNISDTGDIVRTCLANGTWSGTPIECIGLPFPERVTMGPTPEPEEVDIAWIVIGICFFLLMILFVALIIGFGIYRSKED